MNSNASTFSSSPLFIEHGKAAKNNYRCETHLLTKQSTFSPLSSIFPALVLFEIPQTKTGAVDSRFNSPNKIHSIDLPPRPPIYFNTIFV